MRRCTFLLLTLASLGCATPALAIDEFAAGAWKGNAQFVSARFSHCAMLTRDGKWALTVSLDPAGHMNLGLKHADLKFKRNEIIPGWTRIGEAPAVTRRFLAPGRNHLLAVKLSPEDAARLRQGARMAWQVGEVSGAGMVPPSAEAFAKLSACVEKHRRV